MIDAGLQEKAEFVQERNRMKKRLELAMQARNTYSAFSFWQLYDWKALQEIESMRINERRQEDHKDEWLRHQEYLLERVIRHNG